MGVSAGGLVLTKRGYCTAFPATENPISEGGIWLNGGANGTDWNNMRTSGGLCFGTQSGVSGLFDDSVGIINPTFGAWGSNQRIDATVFIQNQDGSDFCEVELWSRATVTAHSITGYECAFSCTTNPYIGIVRWDGALGSFTPLTGGNITGSGLVNGVNHIAIEMVGNVLTAYINGVSQGSRTDSSNTFTSGSPAIGHWLRKNGGAAAVGDYGFRYVAAKSL